MLPRALLICSVLAIPASAFADPPIAVDPSLTDDATLRYTFEQGRTDNYVVEQRMSGPGMQPGQEMSTVMSMTYSLTATEVTDEDALVEVSFSTGSVEITMGSETIPVPEATDMLSGLTGTMRMTPTGQVSDVAFAAPLDPNLDAMLGGMSDTMQQMSQVFPEESVSIGDTWEFNIPFLPEMPGTDMSSDVSATYTFSGWAQHEGATLAVIEGTIDLGMTGTVEDSGMTININLSGGGTSYTYFDLDAGRIVVSSMDMNLHQEVSADDSSFSETSETTITMEMELQ